MHSILLSLSLMYTHVHPVCSDGDVRLVNQSYYSIGGLSGTGGVVQVCVNQQYGYVCSDNWDDSEANVVCRSLSLSYQPPFYGILI